MKDSLIQTLKEVLKEIQVELHKEKVTFGVEQVKQRYLSPMGACIYTDRTLDQVKYAVEQGHLRYCLGQDGVKSFEISDLDTWVAQAKEFKQKKKNRSKVLIECES